MKKAVVVVAFLLVGCNVESAIQEEASHENTVEKIVEEPCVAGFTETELLICDQGIQTPVPAHWETGYIETGTIKGDWTEEMQAIRYPVNVMIPDEFTFSAPEPDDTINLSYIQVQRHPNQRDSYTLSLVLSIQMVEEQKRWVDPLEIEMTMSLLI
ncbi:hypothetical protein Q73_00685 [Bacillus coahuilensis m2-6]|uniref:hypothetical protein n=1 Tax=Bacillus coahuilensis TaxID=408580 RepID=UPI0001850A3B|nr:hypothetical protein [Bacillus coahuilensis]KUP09796.1 hypothetical protein Q73_00685 [Bacillus coahuilensis m2-6]